MTILQRVMSKIRVIFAALLAAVIVLFGYDLLAEDNNLTGVAPADNVDGSPLTDLTSIKIYHSVNQPGGPYVLLDSIPFTVAGGEFSYLHANQGNGMHCYVATAVREGGQESDYSVEACRLIDTLIPRAPTDLTVN